VLIVLLRPPLLAYFGAYHLLPSYFGLWDMVALFKAVGVGSVAIAALTYFTGGQSHPRSVFVLDATLLLFMLCASRYIMRAWSRRHPVRVRQARAKVIVAGAGVAGEHLSRALMEDPHSGFQPVGFIDETQERWGSKIHGVRVIGGIAELPLALSAKKVHAVFVCLSDLPEAAAQEIAAICATAGVDCRMLPSLSDLLRVEGYAPFPTQWGTGTSPGIERAH
jgi:FlaA1/EpsC-like NDP-sugar epimerase